MSVLQALACLAVPALAMWLAERVKMVKLVGPVVLCYAVGIIAANVPGVPLVTDVSMTLNEASVALAIPLLLFSTQVREWLGLARSLLVAFGLACVAAMLSAGVVGWVFRGSTDEWWKIAGMLVGVYVGGTANMSAIGLALEAKKETFVLLNASDVVAGGAYLLFSLTVAKRFFSLLLKPFPDPTGGEHHAPGEAPVSVWKLENVGSLALGLGLALGIVGVASAAALLLTHKLDATVILLVLTTLGLVASMSSKVRSLKGTFELGEYVMLVFCVAVGSLADVRQLTGASVVLFFYVVIVMSSSIAVHMLLCRLFGIDVDTALISSTATIYGPAFVGPVAAAIKNRTLVAPGLTMGLAGIALGTYLGLLTSWVLRWLAS